MSLFPTYDIYIHNIINDLGHEGNRFTLTTNLFNIYFISLSITHYLY